MKTPARSRLLVAGYYGFGNLGDEMILASLLAIARRLWPGCSVHALSGDPEQTAALHGVTATSWTDLPGTVRAVAAADLVLLGGGGLFHDYWGVSPGDLLSPRQSGISYYAGVVALARLLDKRVGLWSLGVGPLLTPEGRELTAAVFREAEYAAVRDAASLAELAALGAAEGVAVVPDPAFAWGEPGRAQQAVASRPPRVGVAVRPWNVGVEPAATEAALVEALSRLVAERGATISFLPFQTIEGELENDLALARRLRAALGTGEIVLPEPGAPWRAVEAIAGLDLLVAMRLHAVVRALSCGVPFVALAYDPKVTALARDLGAERWILPPEAWRAEPLAALADDALARSAEEGDRLRTAARAHAAAAERAAVALFSAPPRSPVPTRLRPLAAHALAALAGSAGSSAPDPVPAPAPSGACDLVCFSIIPWEFRWQRPQQLLSRFAEAGHRVFVLAMDRFAAGASEPFTIRPLGERIWEVELALPEAPGLHAEPFPERFVAGASAALEALAEERGLTAAVGIVQLPSWTPLALAVRERLGWPLVYDCMDDWATFPGIGPGVIAQEEILAAAADLVLASAARLEEKWRPRARATLLVRNAADSAHFTAPVAEHPDLVSLPHPRIGYFGALAEWLDLGLLERVAAARPGYQFVFAGGVFGLDLSRLEALPNVRLLGQRPYAEMPGLLAGFDVGIIPFRVDAVTAATDPVKFYEYLAQGKPVVTTPLPELADRARLFYPARDGEEFLALLDRAVAEDDPALRSARRDYARQNDWTARRELVATALARLPGCREGAGMATRVAAVRAERDRLVARADALAAELAAIHGSRLWRVADLYWRIRRALRR